MTFSSHFGRHTKLWLFCLILDDILNYDFFVGFWTTNYTMTFLSHFGRHTKLRLFCLILDDILYKCTYMYFCFGQAVYMYIYTLPGQKSAFSFDYGTHSLWHCFHKLLQCHKIYFRPVLHSFFTKILYWWWESRATEQSLLQHIPKILNGVKVWTLWWPIHVWKWCLMLPEPLFHNLSLMNPGIVILEYAHVIREEKNALME